MIIGFTFSKINVRIIKIFQERDRYSLVVTYMLKEEYHQILKDRAIEKSLKNEKKKSDAKRTLEKYIIILACSANK